MYLLYGVYFLRVDLGRRSKVNEAICFVRDTEMRSDERIKTSMHLYSMLIALLYINRYILVYIYAQALRSTSNKKLYEPIYFCSNLFKLLKCNFKKIIKTFFEIFFCILSLWRYVHDLN